MSLIYCAKVCVFFIDDHQSVKTTEIGTSENLRRAAETYRSQVLSWQDSDFYRKLEREKKSLERLRAKCAGGERDRALEDKIREKDEDIRRKDGARLEVRSFLENDIHLFTMELHTQFRCNGSDNWLDWLDDVLYKRGKDITHDFNENEYEFGVFPDPQSLYAKIVSLDKEDATPKTVARLVAGYCWKWTEYPLANGDLAKDVRIGNWAMPWETNKGMPYGEYRDKYASSADTWAIESAGINQIGCIFSVQGFELDYVGVILGPDIAYDPKKDCLYGVSGRNVAVQTKDPSKCSAYIRNAYRVLMSRGMRGCFVTSTDPEVAAFLSRHHKTGKAM